MSELFYAAVGLTVIAYASLIAYVAFETICSTIRAWRRRDKIVQEAGAWKDEWDLARLAREREMTMRYATMKRAARLSR